MSSKLLLPIFLLLAFTGLYLFLSRTNDVSQEMLGEVESSSEETIGGESVDLNDPAQEPVPGLVSASEGQSQRAKVPEGSLQAKDDTDLVQERQIIGILLDSDSVPIRGATIEFHLKLPDGSTLTLEKDEEASDVTSNEDGQFAFPCEEEGRGTLEINCARFVPKDVDFSIDPDGNTDVGEIVMESGMVLAGRIVDERGVGIEGVRLVFPASEKDPGFHIGSADTDMQATTDTQGAFLVNTIPIGPWRAWLHAPHHCDTIVSGDTPVGLQASDLLFTLETGLTLRGRVVGIPLGEQRDLGVRISYSGKLSPAHHLGGSMSGFFLTPEHTLLDGNRTFTFQGLHPGATYSLAAVDEEYADESWMNANRILTEPLEVDSDAGTVDLLWASKASIRFLLVSADSQAPVERFSVVPDDFQVRGLFSKKNMVVGEGGSRLIRDLPAKPKGMALRFDAKGYESKVIDGIHLQKGQVTDLGTIPLEAGVFMKVIVRDANSKKSVEGAVITVASEVEMEEQAVGETREQLNLGRQFKVISDASGHATVQCNQGSTVRIKVREEGYSNWKRSGVDWADYVDEPLEVELMPAGTIVVTVLDQGGEVMEGIGVSCMRMETDESDGIDRSMRSPTQNETALSDGRGVARFSGLAAASYEVQVQSLVESRGRNFFGGSMFHSGVSTESASLKRVTINEGEIEMMKLSIPPFASLGGVLQQGGLPMVGAQVLLIPLGSAFAEFPLELLALSGVVEQSQTNREGRYRIESTNPGPKRLLIVHQNRAMPAEFELDLVEGENTFSTGLLVTSVSGKVVDGEGNGLPGFTMSAAGGNGGTGSVQVSLEGSQEGSYYSASPFGVADAAVVTDEHGEFTLSGVLAETPITIVAKAEGWKSVMSEPLTIPPGDTHRGIVLSTYATGNLRVFVRNQAGDPVDGSLVAVRFESDPSAPGTDPVDPISTERTGRDGSVRYKGLVPGRYRVKAWIDEEDSETGEGRAGEWTYIQIQPTEESRLDLTL